MKEVIVGDSEAQVIRAVSEAQVRTELRAKEPFVLRRLQWHFHYWKRAKRQVDV